MMLEVKDIKKYFGGVKALDGTTFGIEEGKITALIGPNGSGKSTIFNVISRLFKEDSGVVKFRNKAITRDSDFAIARKGISRTFQQVRLFRNLTIQDHIEIALHEDDEKLFRSVFKKQEGNLARIKEILKLVRLEKPLTTIATDLSYGQRKLLDLAIGIAKPHDLLMLDEPVAGVNPQLRNEIKDILRELNAQGETILLIEHDMNFVMDLAEYVFVLDHGKVIAHGNPKEIQNNKKVLNAYLGE
jgi:ABC-type branched-subunit amino acid transport system ATPase component